MKSPGEKTTGRNRNTSSHRNPASVFWNISTRFKVSKWTFIAISACNCNETKWNKLKWHHQHSLMSETRPFIKLWNFINQITRLAQHFRNKKIHRIRAFSPCYLIFVSIFLRYSESKPSTTSSVIAILLFERTKDFCKTIFARATTPFSMLTVRYIVSIQLIPAILKCFTAVEFSNCSNHKVL